MLIDRGYDVLTKDYTDYTSFINHFCLKHESLPDKNNLTFIANKNDTSVLVYFIQDLSFGIKSAVKIYDIMIHKGMNHCIIIYSDSITFSAKRFIQSKTREIKIELFCENELYVNKTRHELSPKYTVINESDLKDATLKKQIPKILQSDHTSKYYGLKKGDILKITRSSETMGEYTTLRVVV